MNDRRRDSDPRRPLPPRTQRRPPGSAPRSTTRGQSAPTDPRPAGSTSWDHVAAWYDQLVGETGSDYHQHVILPAALKLLDVQPGERVLDIACGQGVLVRPVLNAGAAAVVGVDASPKLIQAAQQRFTRERRARFIIADARQLSQALRKEPPFDAAACIMAVHDFDPIEPMFAGVGSLLRPGGRLVVTLMHPCFRIPRQSSWGWDESTRTQYRRLDRYHTPMQIPISVSPGSDPSQHTAYFHRPLDHYFRAIADAGLAVRACEELLSHRRSEPGGRSRGENRAKTEFPLFLAMKAVKG